jgi:hypothetical protein
MGEYSVPPDVLVQSLPDGDLVFLDLVSERYYGLDPIGAAMWSALIDTGSLERALEQLEQQFNIDHDQLLGDLKGLIRSLCDRGLLLQEGKNPTQLS